MKYATLTLLVAAMLPGLAPGQSKWPIAPVPMERPSPVSVGVIDGTEWFIIERDGPAVALCSPDGYVSFKYVGNTEACPLRYKGKFAGGGGKTEEKTFTGKFLIEVSAIKTGRCEIFIVPQAVKAETDIERRTVDVKAGDGAQPPPVDPPVTPTDKFYFLIVRPDGPAQPELTRLMGDPAWATLKGKGHQYRDVTLTEAREKLKLDIPAGTTIPAVVTLATTKDGPSKVLRGPVKIPTTGDEILKLPEGVQ